jgi:archaeosine-15-forming tRNA-guanine transglycosylase
VSEVGDAIDRAAALLRKTGRPHTVYRRNGKLAVLPLQTYLDANLDEKGAKRITTITKNASGRVI